MSNDLVVVVCEGLLTLGILSLVLIVFAILRHELIESLVRSVSLGLASRRSRIILGI